MNLNDYLTLFSGNLRDKEKLMALADAVLTQVMDLSVLVDSLQAAYSVEEAVGIQLDRLAAASGLSRRDLGNNVSDADFREYIKGKFKLWTWDGTNAGLPAVLPAGTTETDNMNLTVSVSPAGINPDVLPVPAGMNIAT